MSNKDFDAVDIYRAFINNPGKAFGFFSTFVLGTLGMILADQLDGFLKSFGWLITGVAAIYSMLYFFPLIASALHGGEKIIANRSGVHDFVSEAEIYIAFGKPKAAIDALQKALEVDPDDARAKTLLESISDPNR